MNGTDDKTKDNETMWDNRQNMLDAMNNANNNTPLIENYAYKYPDYHTFAKLELYDKYGANNDERKKKLDEFAKNIFKKFLSDSELKEEIHKPTIEEKKKKFNEKLQDIIKECISNTDGIIVNTDYSEIAESFKKTLHIIMDLPCFEQNEDNSKYKKSKYGIELDDDLLLLLFFEYTGVRRTRFSRDYDRIATTKAIRRLQYKTQVLVNSNSDEQRTRFVHSLEVNVIARALATQLKANSELASLIAIGHDVGHAPYGHAGEKALNDSLEKRLAGNFAHAIQSVKLLNELESHPILEQYGITGIGLSKTTLKGIMLHDTEIFLGGISGYRLQYDCVDMLKVLGKDDEGHDVIKASGIEWQIVYWSDKIAYTSHDWEEWVQFELLDNMYSYVQRLTKEMFMTVERCFDESFKKNLFSNENVTKIIANLEESPNSNVVIKYIEDNLNFDVHSEIHCILKIVTYLIFMGRLYIPDFDEQRNKRLKILIKELLSFEEQLGIKPLNKDIDDKEDITFNIVSKEAYTYFFDYFNIALAWMELTGKYPDSEIMDDSTDIVSIIYNYLKRMDGRTINESLDIHLLENTFKVKKDCNWESIENNEKFEEDSTNKINSEINEKNIDKKIEELIQTNPKINKNDKETRDKIKKELFKSALPVRFDDEYLPHMTTVIEFIRRHLQKSSAVKNMTAKAEMIVEKIFNYHYDKPDMLPFSYRTRRSIEIEDKNKIYNIGFLLFDYLQDTLKKEKSSEEKEEEYNKRITNAYYCLLYLIEYLYDKTSTIKVECTKKEKIEKLYQEIQKIKAKKLDEEKNIEQFLTKIFPDDKNKIIPANVDIIKKDDGKNRIVGNKKGVEKDVADYIKKVITARVVADYVSSMTDRMAEQKYEEITSDKAQWTNTYSG